MRASLLLLSAAAASAALVPQRAAGLVVRQADEDTAEPTASGEATSTDTVVDEPETTVTEAVESDAPRGEDESTLSMQSAPQSGMSGSANPTATTTTGFTFPSVSAGSGGKNDNVTGASDKNNSGANDIPLGECFDVCKDSIKMMASCGKKWITTDDPLQNGVCITLACGVSFSTALQSTADTQDNPQSLNKSSFEPCRDCAKSNPDSRIKTMISNIDPLIAECKVHQLWNHAGHTTASLGLLGLGAMAIAALV